MKIDDETLIAYLDAHLDSDADYERVEDALATDTGLRLRLQQLVESGERARQAFAAKLDEPVPASLIAAIINAPLPTPATNPVPEAAKTRQATQAHGASGLGARLAAWLGGALGGAAAFASVILLALGALLGHYLLPAAIDPSPAAALLARQGELIRDGALLVALETAPSGRALNVANAEVELVVSFMNTADQVCREYGVAHRGQFARTEVGIACRESDNQWRVAFTASQAHDGDAANGYQTASDALHEAANDFVNANVRGAPLIAAEELTLIASGWQRR